MNENPIALDACAVDIQVNCKQVDTAIEKVSRLNELLKETIALIGSLKIKEINGGVNDDKTD